MRTIFLACVLFAIVHYGQSSPPSTHVSETLNYLHTSGKEICALRIIKQFFEDIPYLGGICVEMANKQGLPLVLGFPICMMIAGGADILRLVLDISTNC